MRAGNFDTVCEQFAHILNGKHKKGNGSCSVAFKRPFEITMQGKKSSSILGVDVNFESLDSNGNALNIAEVAILEEEIPAFTYTAIQQGIIISALHNHWLYTNPVIMYIHLQSVEPPLHFAQKMANCLSRLKQYPVPTE
ncbi:DUF1259 domain-containing protein [Bacillus sp. FJAT-49736]|uniref:DUF1259 domain-containing protein n=1 Tax=Bacillus sp. FJAT-49736 TaxID=2833582 RepID=UPI001BC8FB8F|nr:DUF1259 domain-containing protein [Bacillus sp. FJAT-49736]MBS4172852.1 DUF1259 domain-containing protein [Bacillus sp. FJAT-49736]